MCVCVCVCVIKHSYINDSEVQWKNLFFYVFELIRSVTIFFNYLFFRWIQNIFSSSSMTFLLRLWSFYIILVIFSFYYFVCVCTCVCGGGKWFFYLDFTNWLSINLKVNKSNNFDCLTFTKEKKNKQTKPPLKMYSKSPLRKKKSITTSPSSVWQADIFDRDYKLQIMTLLSQRNKDETLLNIIFIY